MMGPVSLVPASWQGLEAVVGWEQAETAWRYPWAAAEHPSLLGNPSPGLLGEVCGAVCAPGTRRSVMLHCWVYGWEGFWGNVRDADHGEIYEITHRRVLCLAQG